MSLVTVSIIIPVYNRRNLLANAIESALSVAFEDKEIIVVDDGSADGSASVAAAYQPAVKLICVKNSGVSCAETLVRA